MVVTMVGVSCAAGRRGIRSCLPKKSGASKGRHLIPICVRQKASRPAIRRGSPRLCTTPRAPLRSARGWEITPRRAAGLRRGSDAVKRLQSSHCSRAIAVEPLQSSHRGRALAMKLSQ